MAIILAVTIVNSPIYSVISHSLHLCIRHIINKGIKKKVNKTCLDDICKTVDCRTGAECKTDSNKENLPG